MQALAGQRVNWQVEARLVAVLPVAAALLLATLDRHQAMEASGWTGFLTLLATIAAAGLPLAAAHLFALRSRVWPALAAWLMAFVAYPVAATAFGGDSFPLAPRHFLIAAAFSPAALLASAGKSRIAALAHRLPLTLDGVALGLLAAWALAATSLFGSTADAVNNQPLRTWFDGERLLHHPLEFAGYLIQFVLVAALLFGFYWVCRHVLVRRVLKRHGWVAFALASLCLWIVYTPLACSLILLLPVNPPDWSLLPSEDHNPFDPLNYGFSFIAWIVIVPVVLASERLLAERREALARQERTRAELNLLQQQINPHFLFNSLNTIYALCLNDRPASAEAVVKLSDLLRYAVYEGQADWVGLDQEIAYLGTYIDLQQLRFGTRCQVSCRWPEDAERLRIPPLLLIMLVENAFKHGVEPVDGAVAVAIDLTVTGATMHFSCTNSPIRPDLGAAPAGLGLANLRRRLELLFDGRFVLESTASGEAWRARLECELRPC